MDNDLILYTTDDGQSQPEMAELHQTSKQNTSKHVKSGLADGELAEGAVVNSKLTTSADGKEYRLEQRLSQKRKQTK